MSKLPDGLEPIDPLTWRTVVARCLLGSTVKLVAYTVANYASSNGADVHPGVKLLMKDTELGDRTVRDALATLRDVGLLHRTFEAASTGLRDMADEHQLTISEDLESRVAMWDPKRKRITFKGVEQAPAVPHKRKKKSEAPATDAGTSPVDNPEPAATDAGGSTTTNKDEADPPEKLPGGNHRQVITEPPATHNGTTGNRCLPPSHAPSHTPSHHTYDSPYGAEVEGKPAERREPSAKSSAAKDPPPTYRQPPLLVAVPDPPPDTAELDDARAVLRALPDRGQALIEAAITELGINAGAQLFIHAATLARRSA